MKLRTSGKSLRMKNINIYNFLTSTLEKIGGKKRCSKFEWYKKRQLSSIKLKKREIVKFEQKIKSINWIQRKRKDKEKRRWVKKKKVNPFNNQLRAGI